MVTIKIRGKEYPLCLTVAALERLNNKGISLEGIVDFALGGKKDQSKAISNTAWLLALLMQEGEENRLVCAELDGQAATRQKVPNTQELSHCLRPGETREYISVALEAVAESMQVEIEAASPKNAEHAEQE